MHRRGPDPSTRAAGRGPSGQGRRRGRLASCSLQAQRLCPPRSPVGEKEFAKQLACAACPAPANAIPYGHFPGSLPSPTSLGLWPESMAERERDPLRLALHSLAARLQNQRLL